MIKVQKSKLIKIIRYRRREFFFLARLEESLMVGRIFFDSWKNPWRLEESFKIVGRIFDGWKNLQPKNTLMHAKVKLKKENKQNGWRSSFDSISSAIHQDLIEMLRDILLFDYYKVASVEGNKKNFKAVIECNIWYNWKQVSLTFLASYLSNT